MSLIACCDAAALPQARNDAVKRIQEPNLPTTVPKKEWTQFTTEHPGCLFKITTTIDAPVYLAPCRKLPGSSPDLTQAIPFVDGKHCIAPYPGDWYVWYDSSTPGASCKIQVSDYGDPGSAAAAAGGMGLEGYSVPTQATVAVTNVAGGVTVLAANPLRKYAMIVNLSSDTIWIAYGKAATLGTAGELPIIGAGSNLELSDRALWRGLIKGISSGGSSDVSVLEGV